MTRRRFGLAAAVMAVTLGAVPQQRISAARPPSVDVGAAQALPCTRAGIATGLMAFAGLINERRFGQTRQLWLTARRLPTPGFFRIMSRRLARAERGSDLAAAVRAWVADGRSRVEVIHVDARPSRRTPLNSGFALAWIRFSDDEAGALLLGRGKGVWDCERRRIAMWVGGEQPIADEAAARGLAAGQCRTRPGNSTLRRYGQTAVLCGLPHGYDG